MQSSTCGVQSGRHSVDLVDCPFWDLSIESGTGFSPYDEDVGDNIPPAMAAEPPVYKALRQQLLWPSIHAAVDIYRRRYECGADAYELTWRLIHISECIVITLASAAVARIRDVEKLKSEYLKLRERCHGLSWNQTEEVLEKVPGAFDGSVDKWIEVLQLVSGCDSDGSNFLQALKAFLDGSGTAGEALTVEVGPLVRAWSLACDPPVGMKGDSLILPPKEALKTFNLFRNRFAHVPFPYDRVNEVWRALEDCTFRIFHTVCMGQSPLCGALGVRNSLLQGPGFSKPKDAALPSEGDVYYCWGKDLDEVWNACPFVHIDKMMRPYVLTRLRNEEGEWEYIRYLAEANAVLRVNEPAWVKMLPPPEKTDYVAPDEIAKAIAQGVGGATNSVTSVPVAPSLVLQTRAEALSALRERQYVPAIAYFKKEVENRPQYHSAWSRLGYAQREYAAHLMDEGNDTEALKFLKEAIKSLTRAKEHDELSYRAEAFYHRSKAYWRLWRITKSAEDLDNAVEDAQRAAKEYYEDRFVRWVEYLEENAKRNE